MSEMSGLNQVGQDRLFFGILLAVQEKSRIEAQERWKEKNKGKIFSVEKKLMEMAKKTEKNQELGKSSREL